MNAADKAFDELSGIDHWFIGGHSMGGAMAGSYAAGHREKVKGLVLLGAHIYGDVPPQDALTVYGTLNADLEKHIDYTDNVVIIQGGNHAQFGDYGEQKRRPQGPDQQRRAAGYRCSGHSFVHPGESRDINTVTPAALADSPYPHFPGTGPP